jgi:hypothetical protein
MGDPPTEDVENRRFLSLPGFLIRVCRYTGRIDSRTGYPQLRFPRPSRAFLGPDMR